MKMGSKSLVDRSELRFEAADTRSRYTLDYPGSGGAKPGYNMPRWVNTSGETGAWSETATATIGA
ncbi:MAG: hypothetical protein HY763_14790 [Planctomycetes bacterium]|nr:hypothetical protein [Planctomycetota bacterium]